MNRITKPALFVAAGVLAVGAVTATLAPQERQLAELPGNPAGVALELLHAQPFQLDEPFVHEWRVERPTFSAGYVLVLRTDPDLLQPRQGYEAVLYVGAETAERCNAGTSGNLVALVPAPLDEDGAVALDLEATPIWFGDPALPEQIDAAAAARALDDARGQRVQPLAIPARARAGTVYARDRVELDLVIADLVELYSPDEEDLVAGLRVPVKRR